MRYFWNACNNIESSLCLNVVTWQLTCVILRNIPHTILTLSAGALFCLVMSQSDSSLTCYIPRFCFFFSFKIIQVLLIFDFCTRSKQCLPHLSSISYVSRAIPWIKSYHISSFFAVCFYFVYCHHYYSSHSQGYIIHTYRTKESHHFH